MLGSVRAGDIPGIPSHRSRKYEEGMGALQGEKKESGKSKGSLSVSKKKIKNNLKWGLI